MSRRRHLRTTPEWVTFGIALAVLGVLVGVLVVQIVRSADPAQPVTTILEDDIAERGGRFVVPVEVVNEGDLGAQAVQLSATLTVGDTTTSIEQSIDFLGAGETAMAVFVFDDDPRAGHLAATVDGFLEP